MKFQLSLGFVFVSLLAFARAAPTVSVVGITAEEIATNSAAGLRLLDLEEGALPVWKTEEEKLNILREGGHFFDVTETYTLEQDLAAKQSEARPQVAAAFPTGPTKSAVVTPLLAQLSTTNMAANLATLTAYNTRYYTSSTGAAASTTILNILKGYFAGRTDVSAALFPHSWVQSSIIAKVVGTNTTLPITILGAHMDSINLNSPSSGRAPGADDDGSGVVNLLDVFRVLMSSGWKPAGPVEFHFYSGEEAGLLGSNAIALSYSNAGKSVKAMFQLDMTAYFKPGTKEVFALEADYISTSLNTYVKTLVAAYSILPVANDIPCGYACSDHASFYKYGYPSVMPFEAVTGNDNQNIHSTGDTIALSGFSWTHSLEFAKVALAFAYELG